MSDKKAGRDDGFTKTSLEVKKEDSVNPSRRTGRDDGFVKTKLEVQDEESSNPDRFGAGSDDLPDSNSQSEMTNSGPGTDVIETLSNPEGGHVGAEEINE